MPILSREKLATFAIEVLVVVFGILIAFQVEEWREDRQLSRDQEAALTRLAEETAANLRACELVVPVNAAHAQSVLAVVRVLNDGHLSDADVELFDDGLIKVGYVTGTPYSETVAAEMIATGLLKNLESTDLRNRIAELPVFIEGVRHWEFDPRGSLQAAMTEVAIAVDFKHHGDLKIADEFEGPATTFEDGIIVEYVFEELVANRTLKNVFIEAADTHLDMWRNHRGICRRLEEIQSLLNELNRL